MVKSIGIVLLGDIRSKKDGITNFYNQFCEYSKSKKYVVHFFMPSKEFTTTIQEKNIYYHYIHLSFPYEFYPGLHVSVNPFAHIRLYLEFQKFFRQGNIEVVQIASPDPFCFTALIASKNLKVPTIIVYHTLVDKYVDFWYKNFKEVKGGNLLSIVLKPVVRSATLLNYFSIRKADHLVVPTLRLKKIFSKRINRKDITVIGRGVDQNRFRPKRKTKKKKVQVLYVGRISPEKNIRMLKFLKNCNHIQLTIVGDGNYINKIRKIIPFARFTGELHGKSLVREYQNADIFLFPSLTDTYGNVVLEAMACGIPVLAFKKGGVDDRVLNGQTGFLATSRNEFRQLFLELSRNESMRREMGKAARKRSKEFTWDSEFDRQMKLYERMIHVKTS